MPRTSKGICRGSAPAADPIESQSLILRHWHGLRIFLDDDPVEMGSNAVEDGLKSVVLTKGSALFAGYDEGAAALGRIAFVIQTAKLNEVAPCAWLKATLEATAAGHPYERLDNLLPWNFKPPSSRRRSVEYL